MIREIFFPEKLFGKRLIPKKILSISLDEKSIKIAYVFAKGAKTEVKDLKNLQLPKGNLSDFAKRASETLKTILSTLPDHDKVAIAVPASLIVFKELKLPLKDLEKIRLVVENELEPMLPFSIEEAIVDFIITRQANDENDTQILAAAIQKQDLQEIIDIYTNAGIEPTNITVDLFALYDLYQQIPEYKNIKNGSVIIEIRQHSTRIAFLQNGELRLVRNIPKGILTVAQVISEEINKTPEAIIQTLQQNGISDLNSDKIIQKHVINFLNDIQFTLNSFTLKIGFYKEIEKILFNWPDLPIPNFESFASNVLQTKCEIFDVQKIFSTDKIINKILTPPENWNQYALPLGVALPSPFHNEFNLRRKSFELYKESLISKQIKTVLILIIIILAAMGTFGYFQISSLSSQAKTIEQREIKRLKQVLLKAAKETKETAAKSRINRALKIPKLLPLTKQTQLIVESEEKAWGNLAKLRLPTLEILSKLTKIVDRKNFNITIKEISIANDAKNIPTDEVVGILKSKQEGEDFGEYAKFEQQLANKAISENLVLVESDPLPAEEEEGGGAKFTLIFKQEEK